MARVSRTTSKRDAGRSRPAGREKLPEIDFAPEIFGGEADNTIGFAGRVCKEPELRYTAKGTAVANLRLAYDVVDREDNFAKVGTTFYTVTIWGDQAEHATECLETGDLVTGLGYAQWFEADDEQYDEYRITAEHVGPSLLWNEIQIEREERPATKAPPRSSRPATTRTRGRSAPQEEPEDDTPAPARRTTTAKPRARATRTKPVPEDD